MDNKEVTPNTPEKKNNWLRYAIYIIIPLLFIAALYFYSSSSDTETLKYSEILELFENDEVLEYTLNISSGNLTYTLRSDETTSYTYTVPDVDLFLSDVHEISVENGLEFDYSTVSTVSTYLVSLLPSLLMMIVFALLLMFMLKKVNQTAMGDIMNETNRTLGFGKAKVKKATDEKRKTTFDDVAGAQEEKEELSELVEFLKEPTRFTDLGARIPKGVLLVGPPGTGKTLLARAVAGEADAPFFSISGSDFVEMYVGVGASRVRDLFDQAKKNSPSIIFIDEIDAVGRQRGAGLGGGHDEREQTLNQLLVEMDGFGINQGVIVIAATNRPDILDPALLRPGRFDRQVTVGYPDIKGRVEILKVHSRGKPLGPDVDFELIAQQTVGFTGADLENLLNEAALLAAKRKLKAITMAEIQESTVKVMVGTEKKSHKVSEMDKKITAYHEAGHAVVTYYLPTQDPVRQVSIVPRGMAGGYTMSVPTEDKQYKLKSVMLDDIVVLLGGRVAESIIFDDISTGASNDIQRATEEARNMVTKYGMSSKLGPINFNSGHDEVFLGRDYSNMKTFSENTAAQIDSEIESIILDAYSRCESILEEHSDKLHKVAEYLIKNEKINGDEFEMLMSDKLIEEFPESDNTDEAPLVDDTNASVADDTADVCVNESTEVSEAIDIEK